VNLGNKTRYIYPALLAVWLIGFGIETAAIARQGAVLRQTYDQLETTAAAINDQARLIHKEANEAMTGTKQLEFLESLVNLLPQEKGFIRTQKAMAAEVEVLRRKVGRRLRDEVHIVVDTRANKLYLKKGLTLVWSADCSAGKGGILVDKKTGRRWEFVTPRGRFEVRNKIENPYWVKPDWAFVETKEAVPPPDDPKRKVQGELGGYVLNLGDGYLIHGTKTEALLGRPASHGCVRLGADNLKQLYETVPVGTPVYFY
jgi:lipoprotein-anchoring transpeptidase ErfK/SrfK